MGFTAQELRLLIASDAALDRCRHELRQRAPRLSAKRRRFGFFKPKRRR